MLAVAAPTPRSPRRRTYRVAPAAEGSKAEAMVVYSLGTHTQDAQDIRGEVTLDPATLASAIGQRGRALAGIHGDGGTPRLPHDARRSASTTPPAEVSPGTTSATVRTTYRRAARSRWRSPSPA